MARSIWFKVLVAGAVSVSTLTYVACGDKATTPSEKVASADVNVQVTASTIPTLYVAPASFPAGVAAFGTTVPTTLTFSTNDTNAATPIFKVKTATDSASGVTTFGSCIFTVTSSTYLAPDTLVVGKRIEVSPCEVKVATNGQAVGDTITNVAATFKLGTSTAVATTFTKVSISSTGVVSVDGLVVGTVDVKTVTGGSN